MTQAVESGYGGAVGAWLESLEEPSNGGLVNPDAPDDDFDKKKATALAPYDAAISAMQDAHEEVYGDKKQWAGTPVVGLSHFQPSEPIYRDVPYRGGFRPVQMIDARTKFAQPTSGLIGGQALQNYEAGKGATPFTSKDDWNNMFGEASHMVKPPAATRPASGYSWESPYPKALTDKSSGIVFGSTGETKTGGNYAWESDYPKATVPKSAYAY